MARYCFPCFRDKPLRIRFRILDPARSRLPGDFGDDITLDAGSFARLDPGVARVFITENEINFLAFPPVRDSLIVFGAGYGFEVLAQAQWLSRCRIHYWGDIDTHGFAILDQLRALFGHVDSFLMDRAALLAFETQWGEEDKPTRRDLPRLNTEERALYDDLRDNRLRKELRLEQERIGFGWVEAAIAKLQDANGLGGPADRHPRYASWQPGIRSAAQVGRDGELFWAPRGGCGRSVSAHRSALDADACPALRSPP